MKKYILIVAGAALLALSWYLFIRPFEYQINFKANTSPGDLIETIRIWDRSIEEAEIIEVDSFFSLKQNILKENREYIYTWYFKKFNDSITNVEIAVSQPERSLLNKISIPFSEQPIEKDAALIAYDFYEVLKEHLEITRVKVIGAGQLNNSFCICRQIETDQIDKAKGMMKYYGLIVEFINQNNLEADGLPIVKLDEWKHSEGKIKYDFCFPIKRRNALPEHHSLEYKELPSQRVVKAQYFGNYITSDRAWYALIDYAQSNSYTIDGHPIEFFHDNPTLGINEKEWKAEVYIPIK